MKEEYLGDGVYASFDGFHVWLDCRAQPSLGMTPAGVPGIALESSVINNLNKFLARCQEQPVGANDDAI